MSRADLVDDLKGSLHDAASIFTVANDADFVRHLDGAARDMARVRPRTKVASIALQAGVATYAAPADLVGYKTDIWSNGKMPEPWSPAWPGRLPLISVVGDAGAYSLTMSPAPSAQMIALFGASFSFYYFAAHAIDDTAANTTVAVADRGLLLLRAQAEAMRELAMRSVAKPTQLRDGISSTPRNGTPSYLYSVLLEEFERNAR